MTKDTDNERLRNLGTGERESRAMTDRPITENRVLSDAERIEMFRMQHFQNVLPDLPKIPGYHLCWLSTTSQNDTILWRERMGYEPVRREDVPGWAFDKTSLKTGEYAGLIGINEMLAYKIPESLYQAYMTVAHHDAPNDQDAKLIQDVQQIQSQAKSNKSYVQSFEGIEELEEGLRSKKPLFA